MGGVRQVFLTKINSVKNVRFKFFEIDFFTFFIAIFSSSLRLNNGNSFVGLFKNCCEIYFLKKYLINVILCYMKGKNVTKIIERQRGHLDRRDGDT